MKREFTHYAKLYDINCYYNEETQDVKGTTWFNDKLLDILIFIETLVPINEEFKIIIIEELKDNNKLH